MKENIKLNKKGFTLLKGAEAEKVYNASPNYSRLDECYVSYSSQKESAYYYCWNLYKTLDPDYKYLDTAGINSYNIMTFTYTFEFDAEGKHWKALITRDYNYVVEA